MTRLVQLTPYPLKAPRHGGQLRCAAIRDCYRGLGIEVETIAVMHEDHHRNERERNDIALPAGLRTWRADMPRFVDLQTGVGLAGDERAFEGFAALLARLRPDAIQFEQPWLYPAVMRWLDLQGFDAQSRPRLIYSSQNIEWKLKRDECASGTAMAAADFEHETARVRALEQEIVAHCDLVVACTDDDQAELRALAGDAATSTRSYVTAHNAIAPYSATPDRVRGMQRRLGLERYPLFIGSAHPPNADGFWSMLAPSLGFLRPDEKIVVAGGVSRLLREHVVYRAWSGINEPRLALLGELERIDLDALLEGASVIVLPITTGGGSNLKTAEAIYSGKPVLATPHALRGYGSAERWPTLTVARTPDAFRRALREMLDQPAPAPVADYDRIRVEVTWQRALIPLAGAIGHLLGLPSAAPVERAATRIKSTREDLHGRLAHIAAVVQQRGGIDYERVLEHQYTRLLRHGDTVVDIGAHAGRHLRRFIDCVGAEGRVFAFEPLPQMHAALAREFRQRNVELHNVALSDTDGRVEFVVAEGAPEESGLRQRTYNNPALVKPRRIEVIADTLDRHVDALERLRFVKIDVEGAELNVLRGAAAVLSRHRPVISVEYGRLAYASYGHDTYTLFDFAEQHGYAMYDIFAHRLDREDWGVACDSVYWDYFMVPLEREAEFARAVPPLQVDDLV